MRLCKNCGIKIPKTVVIDRKQRNLERRKYCLKCNPYGFNKFSGPPRKTGESKLIPYFGEDGKKSVTCNSCDRSFYIGKTRNYTCLRCRSKESRYKNKKKAIDYKGGKCQRCGYNDCINCLCFHHKNPLEKEFTVSMYWNWAWNKLKNEIDKCDLLCSNCHCEVHAAIYKDKQNGPVS